MRWQGAGRLVCHKHRVSVKIGASSDVRNCCSISRQPSAVVAALLLQGSFQCMEPDGEQRTQRGLGTAMYCSARSSAMHTHSPPVLLCLWQSPAPSLALSLAHTCIVCFPFSSSLSSRCFLSFSRKHFLLHTLKAPCVQHRLLHLNYPAFSHSHAHWHAHLHKHLHKNTWIHPVTFPWWVR